MLLRSNSNILKNALRYCLLLFCLHALVSCDTKNENLSSESAILSMNFSTLNNPISIDTDIEMTISGLNISGEINTGGDLTALIPYIRISENATIEPSSEMPVDFTNPVIYTVRAQDGTESFYEVSIRKSSKKDIIRYYFSPADNPSLSTIVEGEVNNFDKNVIVDLPLGADITTLTPTIVIDAKTISPDSGNLLDFSDLKTYTLIADDLSTQIYTVSAHFDKNVLIKFGQENNLFNFHWFLGSDYEDWSGIEVGAYRRVTSLNVNSQGSRSIEVLIPELGRLKKMKTLRISGPEVGVNVLSADFGQLRDLEQLSIRGMGITNVSDQIGNLQNLMLLYLDNNNIASLPSAVGQLNRLDVLSVRNNNLTSLPHSIGNLETATLLDINGNNLTTLPASIGVMQNLLNLSVGANQINLIPAEIGNSPSLVTMDFAENNLNSIPVEISNVSSLRSLVLLTNNLTTIPQAVCDMRILYGTNISTNSNVTCL